MVQGLFPFISQLVQMVTSVHFCLLCPESVPPHQGLRLSVWHPINEWLFYIFIDECSNCHGNQFFPSLYNHLSIPVCSTYPCDFQTAITHAMSVWTTASVYMCSNKATVLYREHTRRALFWKSCQLTCWTEVSCASEGVVSWPGLQSPHHWWSG